MPRLATLIGMPRSPSRTPARTPGRRCESGDRRSCGRGTPRRSGSRTRDRRERHRHSYPSHLAGRDAYRSCRGPHDQRAGVVDVERDALAGGIGSCPTGRGARASTPHARARPAPPRRRGLPADQRIAQPGRRGIRRAPARGRPRVPARLEARRAMRRSRRVGRRHHVDAEADHHVLNRAGSVRRARFRQDRRRPCARAAYTSFGHFTSTARPVAA